MNKLNQLIEDLKNTGSEERAEILQRFFKTGKGQYGEGDVFLGLTMGENRAIAKKYKGISFDDLQELLKSKIHEQRMVSLLILIEKYKKSSESRKEIFDFYLRNTRNVNNWDLVDLSAPNIVGEYLLDKNRSVLFGLAKSENLWERRISILSAFAFIRNDEFEDALEIAEILLKDNHDLIHKAVGWMLREIGKRDRVAEERFLEKYHKEMPRTMLRYAIEKFPPEKKNYYMGR